MVNVSPDTLAELDEAIEEYRWFVEQAWERLREAQAGGDWLRAAFADAYLAAEQAGLATLVRYRRMHKQKD